MLIASRSIPLVPLIGPFQKTVHLQWVALTGGNEARIAQKLKRIDGLPENIMRFIKLYERRRP